MGTRHLIAIYADGEYKLAQYGQWDGYPEGQGASILKFLKEPGNVEKLRANVGLLYEPTEAEMDNLWLNVGHQRAADDNGMVPAHIGQKFSARYPTLSRDCGSKIFGLLAEADPSESIPTSRYIEFAADSLFCEWGYVVDLDKNVLEVYVGYQKDPIHPDERFAFLSDKCENDYTPIRFVVSFPLDALPDVEAFVKAAEKKPKKRKAVKGPAKTKALPAPETTA